MYTQQFAPGRTLRLTQTLPFPGLLHIVLLEPDGIDVDEARCVADHQSAKPSQIKVWDWGQSTAVGKSREVINVGLRTSLYPQG